MWLIHAARCVAKRSGALLSFQDCSKKGSSAISGCSVIAVPIRRSVATAPAGSHRTALWQARPAELAQGGGLFTTTLYQERPEQLERVREKGWPGEGCKVLGRSLDGAPPGGIPDEPEVHPPGVHAFERQPQPACCAWG